MLVEWKRRPDGLKSASINKAIIINKERVGHGKQREATAPIQPVVKLQPWLLNLRWKTCLRQQLRHRFLRLQ